MKTTILTVIVYFVISLVLLSHSVSVIANSTESLKNWNESGKTLD